MLAHLLQGCSHCKLLFTSPCRTAQPVPALSQGASSALGPNPALSWVCQHSCCSFPHCTGAKVMLLGRLVWCRQWLGSVWESAHDGNGHCRSWHMHGSAVAATTPPQAHSPRQEGFAASELDSCVNRRNFPLGKVVCIFALIRLQRNAKGAGEMKHIVSQPNRQINRGKKARVSDQMNSDQFWI